MIRQGLAVKKKGVVYLSNELDQWRAQYEVYRASQARRAMDFTASASRAQYEASWWAGPGEYVLKDGQLRALPSQIDLIRTYSAADIAATMWYQAGERRTVQDLLAHVDYEGVVREFATKQPRLWALLYGIQPKKKGGNVQKADNLLAERQAQRVLEELLAKKEAALAGLGDDEFQNDDVIFFKHQFDEGGTVYSYAALKTGGAWYTTGPRGARYTWDQLKLFMVSGPVPTTSFTKLHRYDEGQ